MVRSIIDIQEDIGLRDIGDAPSKTYVYAAYKGGQVKMFADVNEAQRYSRNTERIVVRESEEAYNTWRAKYNELNQKANGIWMDELRAEYSELNLKVFNKIYSRAYESGHSAGLNEVANEFESLAEFVEEILELKKG